MLRKNGYYNISILFAQFDLFSKNLTEKSETLAGSGNEAEKIPFFSKRVSVYDWPLGVNKRGIFCK